MTTTEPVSEGHPHHSSLRSLVHEVSKFGVVGAFNYVLDVGLFNLLIAPGVLDNKPLTAKFISTAVAATSSYFMNRHWTWRHRDRSGFVREYGVFILLSVVAFVITLGSLAIGEYALHQNSTLARNFWGNVVGVGLAMIWRFWSFRRWVFRATSPDEADDASAKAALV